MNNCTPGFDGERPDPVSGTIHSGNGYRAYNPISMRFHCPDSRSPFDIGGINPYAYCAGDTINRTDPSGHFSLGQWAGMTAGLVAGIALSIVMEGAAMPAMLMLMATVAGDGLTGAGSELMTEAVDKHRINWGQAAISAGTGAAAALAGYCLGVAGKLNVTRNRPFGGLMMAEDKAAGVTGRNVSATAQGVRRSLEFIRDPRNFDHRILPGTGFIISEKKAGAGIDFSFISQYEPERWTFISAYKSQTAPFHMNHVVQHQYDVVSEMLGFRGHLPDVIAYTDVVNTDTLGKTAGKYGSELFEGFMSSALGKTTKHILNDFNLKPLSVAKSRVIAEPPLQDKISIFIPCGPV